MFNLSSLLKFTISVLFLYQQEIAWKRLQGWRNKLLSRAGKEVLLNSVVQSIPSYVMQVFALPNFFCK